jgi:hypothetical protein
MIRCLPMALVMLLLPLALPAAADENKAAASARQLFERYQNAIVHVNAVGKMGLGFGGDNKMNVSAIGTIVDPSGLVVVSTAQLDLGLVLKNVMSSMGRGNLPAIQFELSDVKIRLPDGGEIAAKIILKDDDLGLGFVAPEKPLDEAIKSKLTSLSLTAEAVKPEVLDKVIILTRLSKSLNYQAAVHTDSISAVVTKPRTLYVAGSAGCPVFTAQGKLVGIAVVSPEGPSGGGLGILAGSGGPTAVTIPTSEVRKMADQAKEQLSASGK